MTSVQLRQMAERGQEKASEALTKLAHERVGVYTVASEILNIERMKEHLDRIKESPVIIFTQTITGIRGFSLLATDRGHALQMTDLLNKRPEGTTKILQEIDRSTLQELLNILANAYVSEFAAGVGTTILLDVPRFVTAKELEDIRGQLDDDERELGIYMFTTDLYISSAEFRVTLAFFFWTEVEADER